jgi:hypothetical protein
MEVGQSLEDVEECYCGLSVVSERGYIVDFCSHTTLAREKEEEEPDKGGTAAWEGIACMIYIM